MKKPVLVDGWNPFHTDARYGLPATLVLLLVSYVTVAHFLEPPRTPVKGTPP